MLHDYLYDKLWYQYNFRALPSELSCLVFIHVLFQRHGSKETCECDLLRDSDIAVHLTDTFLRLRVYIILFLLLAVEGFRRLLTRIRTPHLGEKKDPKWCHADPFSDNEFISASSRFAAFASRHLSQQCKFPSWHILLFSETGWNKEDANLD